MCDSFYAVSKLNWQSETGRLRQNDWLRMTNERKKRVV